MSDDIKRKFLGAAARRSRVIELPNGSVKVSELSAADRVMILGLVHQVWSMPKEDRTHGHDLFVRLRLVCCSLLNDDGSRLFDMDNEDDRQSLAGLGHEVLNQLFIAACELSGLESLVPRREGEASPKD